MTPSNYPVKLNYSSRGFRILATIVALSALVLIGRGCTKAEQAETKQAEGKAADAHKDEVKVSAEAVEKYSIAVEAVKRVILTPTLTAPGRVVVNANATAHVGAVLRGRVFELKTKVGDVVKKGDELLIVESPELGEAQSDFLQKRTTAETAKPALELAKSGYDRAKGLYESTKGITLTELQKREIDLRTAEGLLQSAHSSATAAENKLHLLGMDQQAVEQLIAAKEIRPRYSIRAPIDGQVMDREVTLGELVNPDKEALLVLADLSTLWVLADVPEARLAEIAPGAKASVKVAASSTRPIEGTVSYIDPSLDPSTRSARVRIVVKASGSKIRPGMFAEVEIAASDSDKTPEAVLAIPDDAVQTVEGTPAVFIPVTGEPNTFVKHPVTVGKPVNGMVAVVSGLKEGDQIVTRGSFLLKAELGKGSAEE
jgi:cobalt-zinc-cadmium efflux system membrane fusion protein